MTSPIEKPAGTRRLSLVERVRLTFRNHGPRALLYRALTYPLRPTPFRHLLNLPARPAPIWREQAAWYGRNARPVAIVIPHYGPARIAFRAVVVGVQPGPTG